MPIHKHHLISAVTNTRLLPLLLCLWSFRMPHGREQCLILPHWSQVPAPVTSVLPLLVTAFILEHLQMLPGHQWRLSLLATVQNQRPFLPLEFTNSAMTLFKVNLKDICAKYYCLCPEQRCAVKKKVKSWWKAPPLFALDAEVWTEARTKLCSSSPFSCAGLNQSCAYAPFGFVLSLISLPLQREMFHLFQISQIQSGKR